MTNLFKPNKLSKMSKPENQSAGIRDDYAVRKTIATQQISSGACVMGDFQIIGTLSGGNVITNPAGNNKEIQFNDNGVFGASQLLSWDGSTLTLSGANLKMSGAVVFTTRPLSQNVTQIDVGGGIKIGGYISMEDTINLVGFKIQNDGVGLGNGTVMWGTVANKDIAFATQRDIVFGNTDAVKYLTLKATTGNANIKGMASGSALFASNGFTGTGAYTNFTISGGVILAAS